MSQLNRFEKILKIVGGTLLAPFGFTIVPANTVRSVYRFGKFDRHFESGLRWIAPCNSPYHIFTGLRPMSHSDLHLLDKHGNPIIVNSIINYKIVDPKLYIESTNFFTQESIVNTKVSSSLRSVLSTLPFISPDNNDIRTGGAHLSNDLLRHVNSAVGSNGVVAEQVTITEARYAPEIASQMLAKQQARAYVEARNLIVQGAMDTVNDLKAHLGEMDEKMQDQLVVNLLTVMAGNTHAQPVMKL